jgi:hypothetical protein
VTEIEILPWRRTRLLARRLGRRDLETLRLVTQHQGRPVSTVGRMILIGRGLVREIGTGPQDPRRRYVLAARGPA